MTEAQFELLRDMMEAYSNYTSCAYGGQQKQLAYDRYLETVREAEKGMVDEE